MKVLKKGITENGISIQLEEWNEDYNFMNYGSTIAAYPISRVNTEGLFSPRKNEKFRMQYDFKSNQETRKVFNELIQGFKTLKDIEQYLYDKKYKDCI